MFDVPCSVFDVQDSSFWHGVWPFLHMRVLPLLVVLLTMLSCSTSSDKQINGGDSTQAESRQLDFVLYSNETLHHFSSTTEKDEFSIRLTGQSIMEGQFRFQIVTSGGQLLLDESFPTPWLLDHGFTGKVTDKEAEQYIKARVDSFFVEKNFHQPAIAANDEFDGDYSRRETWDDIISDPSAIGFYYLVGKEDGRSIAFSKKQGKVVRYFNCC